jgi:hypothetical protein
VLDIALLEDKVSDAIDMSVVEETAQTAGK